MTLANPGTYRSVGLNWKGAWSGATTYSVNDAVSLSGSSYICILGHLNHTPPNATYWAVLASAGAAGAQGAQGNAGAAGPNNLYTAYLAADQAQSNGAYQDAVVITGLTAAHKYMVKALLMITYTSTPTITYGPNGNTGLTANDLRITSNVIDSTDGIIPETVFTALGGADSQAFGASPVSIDIKGYIDVNHTGDFALRAQRGATGTITIKKGSWLELIDMGT